MVFEIALRCQSAWEMSQALRPQWDGYITVDEKMCSVRGMQQWYYLAVDRTGDILHCCAVRELTVTEAMRFLREMKALGVKVKGIVSDLDSVLTLAIARVYPDIPHQYCIKHALAAIEALVGFKRWRRMRTWNRSHLREQFERLPGRWGSWRTKAVEKFEQSWEETKAVTERHRVLERLCEASRMILIAHTEQEARDRLNHLRRGRHPIPGERRNVVAFFDRHWERLTAHHRLKGLDRTNNMCETVNRQIERRLKTIEAFQHRSTSVAYMNLLIAYLRQRPYTDCRGRRKRLNGKSRLEAAGVHLQGENWVKLALKPSAK